MNKLNKFSFSEKKAWVVERSWEDLNQPNIYKLLYDFQFSELQDEQEEYIRTVEKAINNNILENIAQVNITFNPSFEHLNVHHIRVIRNNNLIWQASEEDFEILRREQNIEKRIYDGCYTANLIIPNFLVNDVLDVAYTRIGSHPVAKDFIDKIIVLNYSIQEQKMHYRLLVKNSTELNLHKNNNAFDPIIIENPDHKEYYWKSENTKIIETLANSPPSFYATDFIYIATHSSWSDISDIFRKNYMLDDEIPSDLEEVLKGLKNKYLDQKQLCIETIKYVQQSIRYLAISIGDAGFIPRRLFDIWKTKYGDCKEKTLILVYCLKYLGFDAAPALVNTKIKDEISKIIPKIYAFNHCIVRVKLGDEISYFDPTFLEQEGNWDNFMRPYYSHALPLIENAKIEPIITCKEITEVEAYEIWDFENTKLGIKVKFHVKTFWRDYLAVNLRNDLSTNTKEIISKNYKDFYEKRYGPLISYSDTSFNDNKEKNEFEINEYYEFEKPLKHSKNDSKTLYIWQPEEYLPDFGIDTDKTREEPYYLGFERRKFRQAIFNLSWPHYAERFLKKFGGNKWSITYNWETPTANQIILKHDYKCEGGVIEINELPEFISEVSKCGDNNGLSIAMPSHSNSFVNFLIHHWPRLIPIGLIILINIIAHAR